jgi:hypothetical protein
MKRLRIAVPTSGDEDEVLGANLIVSDGKTVRIEAAYILDDNADAPDDSQ